MSSLGLITLAGYFVAVYAIGLWTKKRETTSEFLIANRSVGTFLTTASVSAVIGGVFLGSVSALAFELGLGALWLVAGFATGLALLGIVAAKIKSIADEHDFLTLSDYLFTKFDARTGYLGAVILFAAFLFLLAGQFIVGGQLFAALFSIEYSVAVIAMGVATLAYLLLGGFTAVIRTDLLQFAVMLLVFVLLVPLNMDVKQLDLQWNITSPGLLGMASLFLSGVAGMFMGADIWQRVYSARTWRVARNSLLVSATVWLVFGMCLVLLGIAAHGDPSVTADRALFYGLFELLPKQLAGIATVALLAALMSTIDTEVFLLSSSVAKDFISKSIELNQDGLARIVRIAMIGVTMPAMMIAIFWPNVLEVLFVFSSLMLALFPVVLVSLFWTVQPTTAFFSMLVGSLLLALGLLLGWSSPDSAPLLVLLGASTIVLFGTVRRRSV